MTDLFSLESLRRRLRQYVGQSASLRPEAASLLSEAPVRGQFDRGEATRITGLPERTARRVLHEVVVGGLLASKTAKGPVFLRFPASTLETLFPALYPQT